MVLYCVRVMAGKHVALNAMKNYLRLENYPDRTSARNDKANFERACKKFNQVNDQVMYKGNRLVGIDEHHQRDFIHHVHQVLDDNTKAVGI